MIPVHAAVVRNTSTAASKKTRPPSTRPWLPLLLPNLRGRSLRKPWSIRTSTTRRMISPLLPMQLSTSFMPVSSTKPNKALAIFWCASPMSTTVEARGDNKQAADYYRQAIAFIREHPDQYDNPELEAVLHRRVAKLDPSAPLD